MHTCTAGWDTRTGNAMDMKRRTFLASLPAIFAALKTVTLPTPAAAVPTEAPVTGILRSGEQTFTITFPDQSKWSMQGVVTSQGVNAPFDGLVEVVTKVRPIASTSTFTPAPKRASPQELTTVEVNGVPVGNLLDVGVPSMSRQAFDVTSDPAFGGDGAEHYVMGTLRISDLVITTAMLKDGPPEWGHL